MNKNIQDIVYDRLCCIEEQTLIIEEESVEILKMTEKLLGLVMGCNKFYEDNKS